MRTIVISICLLISMMVTADPVTKEAAKERAAAFLTSKTSGVAAARSGGGPAWRQGQNLQERLRLQEQLSSKQHYVFNIGEREGYIILSADDCTGDLVLGYADEGSLEAETMPENMRAWLQGYDDEIEWMKQHGSRQEAAASSEGTAKVRTPIAPMLTTMWDQDSPYNDRCPLVLADPNDGSSITRSATGCVATAIAQVMYWHQQRYGQQTGRWTTTTLPIPAYSQEEYPYPIVTSWTDAEHFTTTQIVEAKEPTTIDWRKFADEYPASDEANAEVAKLIEYIGAGVKMKYGPESAGLYQDVPTMLQYFGYSNTTQFILLKDYDFNEWITLMYNQLKNVGPVPFGGQSTDGGHAFVLDGYDEEDYFHVNWGWGGQSDGYFKLSVLNSEQQGIGGSKSNDGFIREQQALININPDNSTDEPDYNARMTVRRVWTDVTTVERASSESDFNLWDDNPLHCKFFNYSGQEASFEIGFGIYQGHTCLEVIPLLNDFYENGMGYNDLRFSLMFGAGMGDGTYRLVPMCRASGSETWYDMYDASRNYLQLIVSGNKMTLEPVNVIDLKATLAVNENPRQGQPVTVIATVTNNAHRYSNTFVLAEKDPTNDIVPLSAQMADIEKGETAQLAFTFEPKKSGKMELILYEEKGGTDIIAQTTIEVIPAPPTTGILSFNKDTDVTLNQGNFAEGIYGTTVSGTVKITNSGTNDHTTGIRIFLYRIYSENEIKVTDYRDYNEIIPKNSSKEVPFEFKGLNIGSEYAIAVNFLETGKMIGGSYIFDVNHGIDSYTADGTLTSEAPKAVVEVPQSTVALDFTQVSGVTTVVPNSNLNALYYVGSEVPAGLENKHIVKDGTLSSLVLSEGYDFFAPMGFTVTEAPAYARLFAPTGWSAITLPFDVTKVEIDGKTIDCTHLDSETNKSMLLMTFADEAEGIVRFEPAESFDANTPYLITFPGQTAAKIATFYGAENAYIEATTHNNFSGYLYKFAGTLSRLEPGEHYMLNNDGNAFELKPAWRVSSFRSYFKPLKEQHAQTLTIVTDEILGISEAQRVKSPASTALFNIQGMRISKPQQGIYIKNGKKVVVGR